MKLGTHSEQLENFKETQGGLLDSERLIEASGTMLSDDCCCCGSLGSASALCMEVPWSEAKTGN